MWSFYMPAKSILTFPIKKHFRSIEVLKISLVPDCSSVQVQVSVGSESILGLIQQDIYVSDF